MSGMGGKRTLRNASEAVFVSAGTGSDVDKACFRNCRLGFNHALLGGVTGRKYFDPPLNFVVT